MRGPVDCPDCGVPRLLAGFAAHPKVAREQVRLYVCRACHVLEMVSVSKDGVQCLERRREIKPQTGKILSEPEPA
jgi:hypothetical protein